MKSTSTIIPKIRRLKIDTFMNLKLLKTKVESMSSEKSSVFNPVLKISLLFTSFSLSIKYQCLMSRKGLKIMLSRKTNEPSLGSTSDQRNTLVSEFSDFNRNKRQQAPRRSDVLGCH